MKSQRIELNEKTDIFEADITIVSNDDLFLMMPNLELENYANEFVVKKHKKHLELIPLDKGAFD
jgi:hypothetical protein